MHRNSTGTRQTMNSPLLLLAALLSTTAFATGNEVIRDYHRSPFERTFGLGSYITGWAGSYGGAGFGARIRVEPFSFLGVDLFGEALIVTSRDGVEGGIRHDHPIGFNLYVPIRLGKARLRPFLGMCVVASLIEPTEPMAPRADDVLVGAHAGLGLEFALHTRLSFFVEAKGLVYVGHDRSLQGWTAGLDNQVRPFGLAQAQTGFMFHL